jgi:UDP-2,3-diacylglucosamine pyrophosphatase LpxH
MSSTKVIVSDLHLADGHRIFDSFPEASQAAFEGLLSAMSSAGPLGNARDVELIINGDAFDFLATPPYDIGETIDSATALEKMRLIAAAHQPFFETLGEFLAQPGHHITFITGNHDIELSFVEIQAAIAQALGVEPDNTHLAFCPTRFYQPTPDIYIEHGNQYDFWNRTLPGIWDEQGQLLNAHPQSITFCPGSRYFQHAGLPLSLHHPYFDHLEPSINILRQIALLCLLDPAIVKESAQHVIELMAEPRPVLANLAPGEEIIPSRLFAEAMLDFLAFQQDMEHRFDSSEPATPDDSQVAKNAVMEYTMLQETLKLPLLEAVAAVCTPTTYLMGEGVARDMHRILSERPTLRYAIAGHTHMVRIDPVNDGQQSYLNTGSWTIRVAPPAPGEVTPALVAWLRKPDWSAIPLRDVTQRVFALLTTDDDKPASASLCVWDGGRNGNYHVLA